MNREYRTKKNSDELLRTYTFLDGIIIPRSTFFLFRRCRDYTKSVYSVVPFVVVFVSFVTTETRPGLSTHVLSAVGESSQNNSPRVVTCNFETKRQFRVLPSWEHNYSQIFLPAAGAYAPPAEVTIEKPSVPFF